jgi:hypothetical protein
MNPAYVSTRCGADPIFYHPAWGLGERVVKLRRETTWSTSANQIHLLQKALEALGLLGQSVTKIARGTYGPPRLARKHKAIKAT